MENNTYGKQLFTKQQCRKLIYIICFHWVLAMISDGINSDICWTLTVLQCRLSKTLPVQRDLGILIVSSLEGFKKKSMVTGYYKNICVGARIGAFRLCFLHFFPVHTRVTLLAPWNYACLILVAQDHEGLGRFPSPALKRYSHLWRELRPTHILKTNQKVLYFIRNCSYEVNIQKGWRARRLV